MGRDTIWWAVAAIGNVTCCVILRAFSVCSDAFTMLEREQNNKQHGFLGVPAEPSDFYEARNCWAHAVNHLLGAPSGQADDDTASMFFYHIYEPKSREAQILLQLETLRCYSAADGTVVPVLAVRFPQPSEAIYACTWCSAASTAARNIIS